MTAASARSYAGPRLAVVGGVFVALFIASLVVLAAMSGGAPYPLPFGPLQGVQAYFSENIAALRISSSLQFAAAIPLGIFTATVVGQLGYLGVRVAGVNIALFGGLLASAFLALSGLFGWVLARPEIVDELAAIRVLQLLQFLTGGVGHVVPLGLLLAGVSVPAGLFRLVPGWIMWFGLLVAACAELSVLSLVVEEATFLLPIGRFGALVWILAVGFLLPRSKEQAG